MENLESLVKQMANGLDKLKAMHPKDWEKVLENLIPSDSKIKSSKFAWTGCRGLVEIANECHKQGHELEEFKEFKTVACELLNCKSEELFEKYDTSQICSILLEYKVEGFNEIHKLKF
jgi:hypothetical protein